ncbi:uncharacterized protein METZ01_LOCUS345795, partial [marine metagenome]
DWLKEFAYSPILASGMIGARQGWNEVPYADVPAGLADLQPISFDGFEQPFYFVPGLVFHNPAGVPDIMRGEETQVVGIGIDGIFLLPGSHSKWVLVRENKIIWFATFMTGELFAALKDHTILGRMMAGTKPDDQAFSRGVSWGEQSGSSLQALFSARTLALFGDLPESGVADYLSGLLIGAEIAEARDMIDTSNTDIIIVGGQDLSDRYEKALAMCGLRSRAAAKDAAARGHWRIAKAAGLVAP